MSLWGGREASLQQSSGVTHVSSSERTASTAMVNISARLWLVLKLYLMLFALDMCLIISKKRILYYAIT